jgi:hypothetical protein
MFVALAKLAHQGIKQAIMVVPEKSIGASFSDERLSDYGFFADYVRRLPSRTQASRRSSRR